MPTGPQGHAPPAPHAPTHFIKGLISQKPFVSPPLSIYICVPYDKMHPMTLTGGPQGHAHPFHFINGLISQKPFRSPPLNHIYIHVPYDKTNPGTVNGGPQGHPHPLHLIKALISQKPFRSSPHNHIYIHVPGDKTHPVTPTLVPLGSMPSSQASDHCSLDNLLRELCIFVSCMAFATPLVVPIDFDEAFQLLFS